MAAVAEAVAAAGSAGGLVAAAAAGAFDPLSSTFFTLLAS